MSNEQDGVMTSGGTRELNTEHGEARQARNGVRASERAREEAPEHWGRYLIAPAPAQRLPTGVPPVSATDLFAFLEEDSEALVLGHLPSHNVAGAAQPLCPAMAMVAMPDQRAWSLASNPQVVIEWDQPLLHTPPSISTDGGPAATPAAAPALDTPATLSLQITGKDNEAIEGAHVWALGAAGTAHAITNRDGRVRLDLPSDTPATIQSLHVRPAKGYWPLYVEQPGLPDTDNETVIPLCSLAETFEGFPARPLIGWGVKAMRLDQLPTSYRGGGVRIAILDSGIATAHPDLKDNVTAGYDFTPHASGDSWRTDSTGRGTWCAGIIGATDNGTGIIGTAPGSEIHALKLFPGGRLSDLLRALDYCVTEHIDIAQINTTFADPSHLAGWKLLDTAAAGVTALAPAGDYTTTLAHPAALPGVIAVGALAHSDNQIYPAACTPKVPGIDLYAPGADVITTSHHGDYTPATGTALAAAHITALTALLLAHHQTLRVHIAPQARIRHLHALLRNASHSTVPYLLDAPTALNTISP